CKPFRSASTVIGSVAPDSRCRIRPGNASSLGPASALSVETSLRWGIEVRRAAQAVSGATRGRGVLAKMMDQSDRDAGFSLQRPEVSEERGDLTGYIFVDGMDSHQRIEYEQHRVMDEDRGLEPVLVFDAIQAERLRCDNPDIETREVELADPG